METRTDNRAAAGGYALLGCAIGNIVLLQLQPANLLPWLILTCTATAGMAASRIAREGPLGRELQMRVEHTPLWQVFGLGIALFLAEITIASHVSDPAASLAIRKIFGPLSVGLIFVGVEMAIFRKTKPQTNHSKSANQA